MEYILFLVTHKNILTLYMALRISSNGKPKVYLDFLIWLLSILVSDLKMNTIQLGFYFKSNIRLLSFHCNTQYTFEHLSLFLYALYNWSYIILIFIKCQLNLWLLKPWNWIVSPSDYPILSTISLQVFTRACQW